VERPLVLVRGREAFSILLKLYLVKMAASIW
jgi:hypothetical protein